MSFYPAASMLPQFLIAVLFVVGAVLMGSRLSGAPRTCGVIGAVLLAVLSLWSSLYSMVLLPRIFGSFDSPQLVMGTIGLLNTLLYGVGYALLIAAAVLRRAPEGPAQFGGYGGYGPGTGQGPGPSGPGNDPGATPGGPTGGGSPYLGG